MEHGPNDAAPAGLNCLARQRLLPVIRRWWDRLVRPAPPFAIDVALLDAHERRLIARTLRETATRRAQSLGLDLPGCLSVLVDYTITADDATTACLETLLESGEPVWYIIRLALTRRGVLRPLDAVVADLNELLLLVLTRHGGWSRTTLIDADPDPVPPFARRGPGPTWKGAPRDGDDDGESDPDEPRRHPNRARKYR